MKLYLASFFEPYNHGPGRKIGVSVGKPSNIDYDCDLVAEFFSPDDEDYWDYQKFKKVDMEKASNDFVDKYKTKLDLVCSDIKKKADEQRISVFDILPFKEGDTLLSWERVGNVSYRPILADYLEDLGYEVESN